MRNDLLPPVSSPLVNALRRPEYRPHPEDTDGCVFLRRACEKIGAAKYGDEWTGQERLVKLPDLLPDALNPMLTLGLLP